jgi:hypothetical protein
LRTRMRRLAAENMNGSRTRMAGPRQGTFS